MTKCTGIFSFVRVSTRSMTRRVHLLRNRHSPTQDKNSLERASRRASHLHRWRQRRRRRSSLRTSLGLVQIDQAVHFARGRSSRGHWLEVREDLRVRKVRRTLSESVDQCCPRCRARGVKETLNDRCFLSCSIFECSGKNRRKETRGSLATDL